MNVLISYRRRISRLLPILLLLVAPGVPGQELEPRSYLNLPKGMNFAILGGAYQEGEMLLDPGLNAEDAVTRARHLGYGFLHTFGIAGKSAKFTVGGAYTEFSARGLLDGVPASREDQGFSDPKFKLSVNLLGSPALSLKEFKNYRQNTIFGVSLGITAPWGQYDSDKAINIGFNRWAIRPEIGFSKRIKRWFLEGSLATSFFTDNTNFYGGMTREQDPISSLQFHVVYIISPAKGLWVAFDSTYYRGGQTTVDGLENDNELRNSRYGATFAMPVNRNNSLKFYLSEGANSRRGSEYTVLGMAWQYRWGGGF